MPNIAKVNQPQRSPQHARKYNNLQRNLNKISSSISNDVFNEKESLPVDRAGRVDIHPSHPDYQYWMGDDE